MNVTCCAQPFAATPPNARQAHQACRGDSGPLIPCGPFASQPQQSATYGPVRLLRQSMSDRGQPGSTLAHHRGKQFLAIGAVGAATIADSPVSRRSHPTSYFLGGEPCC